MADEVKKFDPSKLMQGVKDRIKATFVSLIPDTQWETMVDKEIDAFFNEKVKIAVVEKSEVKEGRWHPTSYLVKETEQPPFRAIVWQLCYEKTLEVLKEKIKTEYFTDNWVDGRQEITEAMKQIIAESAPLALQNLIQFISVGITEVLRQQLHRTI